METPRGTHHEGDGSAARNGRLRPRFWRTGRAGRPSRGGEGGDQGGERRRFGGEPSPEAEALQKAIEAKASNDEIKAKLAKYRDAQKVKQANLEKAQSELRQVLSVKQEASAVMMGLLQ